MPTSSHAPLESIQARLESVSMRLDAATDNLMQTRDLFIRHMEQQMLQLQEVRHVLHEAAIEAAASLKQTVASEPPTVQVKPVGELTLESLFAPLNAVPRAPVAPVVDVEMVEEPRVSPAVGDPASASVVFEAEPMPGWDSSRQTMPGSVTVNPAVLAPMPMTSDKPATGEIDPNLEKATLDELNEALTRAFAQIANRGASR